MDRLGSKMFSWKRRREASDGRVYIPLWFVEGECGWLVRAG
jgi:hypothetical protein